MLSVCFQGNGELFKFEIENYWAGDFHATKKIRGLTIEEARVNESDERC